MMQYDEILIPPKKKHTIWQKIWGVPIIAGAHQPEFLVKNPAWGGLKLASGMPILEKNRFLLTSDPVTLVGPKKFLPFSGEKSNSRLQGQLRDPVGSLSTSFGNRGLFQENHLAPKQFKIVIQTSLCWISVHPLDTLSFMNQLVVRKCAGSFPRPNSNLCVNDCIKLYFTNFFKETKSSNLLWEPLFPYRTLLKDSSNNAPMRHPSCHSPIFW